MSLSDRITGVGNDLNRPITTFAGHWSCSLNASFDLLCSHHHRPLSQFKHASRGILELLCFNSAARLPPSLAPLVVFMGVLGNIPLVSPG